MVTVIIAGGSGTRLWPLSTSSFPKHLLTLVGERSMLQSTYERASNLGDTVYVMTEASHAEHVRSQLPELAQDRFIVEPGRRGTANCIVMALDVIARRHGHDEPVAIIHADHQVRDVDGFRRSLEIAASTAVRSGVITLIGIEPSFPATGFGYIQRGTPTDREAGIYHVSSFKEKPDFELAKQYVRSGKYLWNCGYFVGTVNVFLNEMKRSSPDLYRTYSRLRSINKVESKEYADFYLRLANDVIDTALIEKTKELRVVAASFDWMDIGSFKDLHEANESDEKGNHLRGDLIFDDEVENAYIRNEEEKPVVVIGLDNVVVINTKDGVLVARKDLSQKVKDAVQRISEK